MVLRRKSKLQKLRATLAREKEGFQEEQEIRRLKSEIRSTRFQRSPVGRFVSGAKRFAASAAENIRVEPSSSKSSMPRKKMKRFNVITGRME